MATINSSEPQGLRSVVTVWPQGFLVLVSSPCSSSTGRFHHENHMVNIETSRCLENWGWFERILRQLIVSDGWWEDLLVLEIWEDLELVHCEICQYWNYMWIFFIRGEGVWPRFCLNFPYFYQSDYNLKTEQPNQNYWKYPHTSLLQSWEIKFETKCKTGDDFFAEGLYLTNNGRKQSPLFSC